MNTLYLVWVFGIFDKTARQVGATDPEHAVDQYLPVCRGILQVRGLEHLTCCVLERSNVRDIFDLEEAMREGTSPSQAKQDAISEMEEDSVQFPCRREDGRYRRSE